MKRITSLSIAALLSCAACTKHPGDALEPATAEATLVFAQPLAGAVYQRGDSVRIAATAIAPATIHGYDVEIHAVGDTTRLFYTHVHDHNDTLLVRQAWADTLSTARNLEVQVTLVLDHEGTQLKRSVAFRSE
ncbi:MAG: hypothetical protein EOO11_16180 [Chitinophagaceae bacterium]|nr:MAG: hypothetical protein EOO11_16180 [Chitinophagaceae bacterium]